MFSGVSNITNSVDTVFLIFLVTAIVLFSLIVFLMVFFVIRYSRKRHATAVQIEGSTTLEVVWTVVSVFIVLGLFYFGWQGYRVMNDIPDDAMEVKVTGSTWQWNFEYPNGKVSSELNVPVDRPIKLHLTALDVIHSFYVPAFRLKEDAVPGMNKYTWFQAKQVGEYDILCAEYCGLNHSYMLSKVIVMPQSGFDTWYHQDVPAAEDTSAPASDEGTSEPATEEPTVGMHPGTRILWDKGCPIRHMMPGPAEVDVSGPRVANAIQGPSFSGLFGRKVQVVAGDTEREMWRTNPTSDTRSCNRLRGS